MDPIEWVATPQQPDATSCGVLVVAQVHNYLTGNIDRQYYRVFKNDVKIMRLRLMWVIMHLSHERLISNEDLLRLGKSTRTVRQSSDAVY
ncbi:unnamed protein product [Phytophthora fragariaefolia]|uniref:Unnamed protein product n=1 Tax=Phytophthora fragariaefolia TaxID=1490495 RepID=A0A9W6XSL7_9STRA|nr:unnamed protein product [Phytophthora fragariaefolia]